MRCFEMPWMHDPEWRELLAPVFQAAGIPFNKVHAKYATRSYVVARGLEVIELT